MNLGLEEVGLGCRTLGLGCRISFRALDLKLRM